MQRVSTVLERGISDGDIRLDWGWWYVKTELQALLVLYKSHKNICKWKVAIYIGLAGGNTKKCANKKSWREHNSIRTLRREFMYNTFVTFFRWYFYRCGDGILWSLTVLLCKLYICVSECNKTHRNICNVKIARIGRGKHQKETMGESHTGL